MNITEWECANTTLQDLRDTFERVGDYSKPVPKIGRPKIPEEVKYTKAIKRESERIGAPFIFSNREMAPERLKEKLSPPNLNNGVHY